MKKYCLFWIGVFFSVAAWASTGQDTYDYPFVNPYEATVLGTPMLYKAEMPEKVPMETFTLTVFPDRKIPEVLWFHEGLELSMVAQEDKAPLIFNIAGTGAGHDSTKMKAMQKQLYAAGFHVISLPSPTHPNFVACASTTQVPGNIQDDTRDLYRVMELAWQAVKDDIEVSEFYLTGYSLGAAQAAFVSLLDETAQKFNFKKVLMINPPVSLFNSVKILDRMLVEYLPGNDLRNIDLFFDGLFKVLSEYYQTTDYIDFNDPDLLYDLYRKERPSEKGLVTLIGVSFRISSANMIFTSDVTSRFGYVVPKNRVLSPYESLSPYFRVTHMISFEDYFHEMFYPYFKAREPGLTEQALIDRLSLKSIEPYLRKSAKIGVMHNEDDIILAPGEIDFFKSVFGDRAVIYPNGGHCGNMDYKRNVAHMINFFSK